jgi:hypothetical protein
LITPFVCILQRKERVTNYTWPVKAAALLTFLATFLTFSTTGSAGWLNPHMEIYPDCTEALTLRSSELLDLTRNSELFVVMANPEIEDMDKPFRQSPTEINRPTLLNYPALGNVRRTRFFQSIR